MNAPLRPVPRKIHEAAEQANDALEGFFGSHDVVAASLLAIALKFNDLPVPQHLQDTLADMANDLKPDADPDASESPE